MMIAQKGATLHTPIPYGVADYFWEEAYARRTLETGLLQLFRTWGYGDVIPPMFEFASTYDARASSQFQSEVYRFLDRDGSSLALRADLTIPVARLVGTRLYDRQMPQRFCYAGNVFRYTEPQGGRQREFWQAGIELFGSDAPASDAEVIALTARALEFAGLTQYQLVLGQMQYFHGLLENLEITPNQQAMLQKAIDRNSEAALEGFLRATPLGTQQQRTIAELPQLCGTEPYEIIERAEKLCLSDAMYASTANLRAICQSLEAHNLLEHIFIDLTEIHDLGYYTGLTFEALTPQLGFSVASGGRYDNLLDTFGTSHSAVGVALGIDRLLAAKRQAEPPTRNTRPVPLDILAAVNNDPQALAIIDTWRKHGLRVALHFSGDAQETLCENGRRRGAQFACQWQHDGFRFYPLAVVRAEDTTVDSVEQSFFIDLANSHEIPSLLQAYRAGRSINQKQHLHDTHKPDISRQEDRK